MPTPADIHFFEQLHARAIDIARIVVSYRRELVDGGWSNEDAWASAQRLEKRLWDAEIMPVLWALDDEGPEPVDP